MRLRPDLDGKLFADDKDGGLWLIYFGCRHRVASPSVSASLFSEQSRAEPGAIADIRIGDELNDGSCLVREHGGLSIYMLTGCRESLLLHHVTTYESFIDFGFDLGKVVEVPRLLFEQVAHGRRLTSASDRAARQNWAGPNEAALAALRSVLAAPREPLDLAPGAPLVVCTHGLSPGGAERQWVYLAEALGKRGFDVTFVVYGRLEGEEAHYLPLLQRAAVRIIDRSTALSPVRLTDRARRYLESVFAPERETLTWLAEVFARLEPKAVFAQLDLTNILCGIAGRVADVPRIVLSFRNSNPTHFHYMDSDWYQPIYRELAAAPTINLSGNSRAGNLDYAEWLNIDPDQVTTIPNALNSTLFPPPRDDEITAVRRELGLQPGARVLLGAFRLSAEKAPFTFLGVCARVMAARPDVVVIIAGVGPFREQMQARIDQLGLAGRVHMLGRRSDVNVLMAVANVLLLTSLREGMPNVVLEALASGLPIVATEVGGVGEIVEEGGMALLHEVGDLDGLARSCLAVLDDDARARRMSSAGKARALDFSCDALAARHLALLP